MKQRKQGGGKRGIEERKEEVERGNEVEKGRREGEITTNIHCINICVYTLTNLVDVCHNATVFINRIYYICIGDIGLLWHIRETT